MEKSKSGYPCKPFPYRRFPFGYKYPCKGTEDKKKTDSIEKPVAVKEVPVDEKPVAEEPSVEVIYWKRTLPLKRKCSFPYFRSCRPYCRHRLRSNTFNSYWYKQFLNEWEREKETLVCISPPLMDSYERLCRIPICRPVPVVHERQRGPFNVVHCVFCDGSLYLGGVIYDLHESVPAIKRQSNDKDDDVAYRIGDRTRVTVHKSCYDKYLKDSVPHKPEYVRDEDSSDVESEMLTCD